jgi:2-polyprenyl-6-methoxyphenol hydroxylase-like FAD-dependent oxidoreductase
MVVGESWGRGQRFGIVPMGDGRVYWYATKDAPEGQRDADGRAKQNLVALFSGWHEPIPALLAATEEAAILRNDIYDRDPLRRWSEGRVTLLGDAAHPMTPNLGQGACQAIEDSVVLAACLKKAGKVEAGLHEYQERRIPRTNGMVEESRKVGEVAQWRNPLLCWVRDALVAATSRRTMLQHVTSMIAFDGLTAEERKLLAGVEMNAGG